MNREIWGYARVSSTDQNLERQIREFKELGIDERHIIKDMKSGKDFDRRGYNSLVGTNEAAPLMREGDLLVIASIDRLGRNYEEIKNQWRKITQDMNCDIKVIDMPLLDTSNKNNDLDSTFVAELVLQILSYVAEKERRANEARRTQGINVMDKKIDANGKEKRFSLKTGRPTGRPLAEFPDNWESVYHQWKNKEIKAIEAMQLLDVKKNTFYNLVKRYEAAH